MKMEAIEVYVSDSGDICLKQDREYEIVDIVAINPSQVRLVCDEMIRLAEEEMHRNG